MYDKSDGSRAYNKNERGGWYCTNPRKHHDTQLHHGSDEPHNHTAKRNDSQPRRQPESRTKQPTPQPAKSKAKGCGCFYVIFIILFTAFCKWVYNDSSSDSYDYDEVIVDTIYEDFTVDTIYDDLSIDTIFEDLSTPVDPIDTIDLSEFLSDDALDATPAPDSVQPI